jgi:hypothetical protein
MQFVSLGRKAFPDNADLFLARLPNKRARYDFVGKHHPRTGGLVCPERGRTIFTLDLTLNF